ncbi:hypothetical protein LCGC14_2314070 [marine sediment metagenome]|uniref:Uncharacterized protein n=1 Tax=marine sediment metagenome TaxID=412755 RepID=A0A0F9CKB5_9ZZZZ
MPNHDMHLESLPDVLVPREFVMELERVAKEGHKDVGQLIRGILADWLNRRESKKK